jgi:chemotaxis regulatin CheY-phosphate phosphatase CheZ
MASLNQPNVRVQYLIKQETVKGQFNDALYFSRAGFLALAEQDLQAQIIERVQNWITYAEQQALIVPVEPTVEELEAQKLELENQLSRIINKIAEK